LDLKKVSKLNRNNNLEVNLFKMNHYKFKLKPENIKDVIPEMGSCIASDKITVDGWQVGFMYREEPQDENDSGWRFTSGDENQEYMDDPLNSMIFEVNVIANYDSAIIPFLELPIGSELERLSGTNQFVRIKKEE
jgi:hypothetical protein